MSIVFNHFIFLLSFSPFRVCRALAGLLRREAGGDRHHRQGEAAYGSPDQEEAGAASGPDRVHRVRTRPVPDSDETPIRGAGPQNIAAPRTTTTSTPRLDANETARQEALEEEEADRERAALGAVAPLRAAPPPPPQPPVYVPEANFGHRMAAFREEKRRRKAETQRRREAAATRRLEEEEEQEADQTPVGRVARDFMSGFLGL